MLIQTHTHTHRAVKGYELVLWSVPDMNAGPVESGRWFRTLPARFHTSPDWNQMLCKVDLRLQSFCLDHTGLVTGQLMQGPETN